MNGLQQFGSSGTQVGLATGATSCNNGNVPFHFYLLPNPDHSVVSQNLYRMSGGASNNDRFEQLGYAWNKHTFGAAQEDACGFGCTEFPNQSELGVGCSDPYAASQNAEQDDTPFGALGSRAWINPFTGFFPVSPRPENHAGHVHTGTSHRIAVERNDLNPAMNPGATYYLEVQYDSPHEYAWCQTHPGECNMYNNASYRRYNVSGTTNFTFAAVGAAVRMKPATHAWTGATTATIEPEPGVDGRAFVVYKVTNPSAGVWHYEYAIHNQNLDRSIQSFSVPLGNGITVSNVGFRAPPNHPGFPNDGTVGDAGFSNAAWTSNQTSDALSWNTETFAQNPNANAIRFGTLYNFRFDSNRPPQAVNATIGFLKTGTPITVGIQGPSPDGGASPTPSPTPSATPTPTSSPTPTATATATATATPCCLIDSCFDAEVIPPDGFPHLTSLTVDITNATTFGDPATPPSCQANVSRSLWYTFTPHFSSIYVISSCANAPTGTTVDDTVMAIYTSTGGCNGPFTEIPTGAGIDGCDDDSCATEANQAVINTGLNSGTTYYIVIWKSGAAAPTAGNTAVQLRVTRIGPPTPTPTPTATIPPTPTPTPATPTPTPTATATPIPSEPPVADVAVSIADSPDPVQVGQNLTYTITVSMGAIFGVGNPLSVTMQDNLPGSVNLVSVTPSQGSCEVIGTRNVFCQLGILPAFSTATVTLAVTPLEAGPLSNTASAFAGGSTDPNPGNNSATASTTVVPATTPTPTPTVTPSPTPAQALNLSTRMRVLTGDNVGIGGFIITGTTTKHVLIRAIGPSLAGSGVPNVLADPTLELNGPGSFVTITNNDWRDDPTQEALIEATGIPPTNDLESAIEARLAPGSYTAIVRGNGNTSGVGLVEVYDLNSETDSKLANISTRAFVSTGDNIVIAGFMLGGDSGDDRIVVRGIGPSLSVPGPLANPTLELRNSNGALLLANNDWQDDPAQAAELTAADLAPTNSLESGIAMTLPPGLYTALLAGVNNGTGIGLVEVYDRGSP